MNILLFNVFFYFYLLIFNSYRKKGFINPTSFIILIYLFFAINSVLIFNTDYYKWDIAVRNDMSWGAILFLCFSFLLYMWPLLIKKQLYHEIKIENKKKIQILFIVSSIVMFIGGALNYNIANSVADFTDVYKQEYTGGTLAAYSRTISTAFIIPTVLLIGYYFSIVGLNLKKGFLLLFLYIFNRYIESKVGGSRGVLFFTLLDLAMVFVIFRTYIPKRIIKYIFIFLVITLFFFFSLIFAISQDRFGGEMWEWIASYFGEPFINFPLVYWNSSIFFDGALTFALYVEKALYSRDIVLVLFKTLPGNLYLDFGIIKTFLFLGLLSLFFNFLLKTKNKIVDFAYLIKLLFVLKICYFGIFSFWILGWSGYLVLIIVYYFLKLRLKK